MAIKKLKDLFHRICLRSYYLESFFSYHKSRSLSTSLVSDMVVDCIMNAFILNGFLCKFFYTLLQITMRISKPCKKSSYLSYIFFT